jgi:hypothetical protein
MKISKIQGNSLWYKVPCETWAEIDPIWANFAGSWEIFDALWNSQASGTLLTSAETPGEFFAKISTAVMTALPVASYTLVTQVKNISADFEEERHDTLKITKTERIP